jgi:hypothetical protein
MSAYVVQDDSLDPGEEYLTYAYRTSHQVLQWLPTKLAEWIGANLCEELNIPDKQSPLWTAVELNAIITGNLVGSPHGHLHMFGCIQ